MLRKTEGKTVNAEKQVLSVWKGRPAFSPESCINRRQRRCTCTVCTELCPRGVFSLKAGENLRWDSCIDCGLCVSLCPTRCLTPSPSGQRALTEGLSLEHPAVYVCREGERPGAQRVRCLAAVPWELLAFLALHTEVVLDTGRCANCEHPDWAGCVEEQLALLQEFLGEERFESRVRLLKDGEAYTPPEEPEGEEREVSRRGLFAGIGRRAAKGLVRAAEKRLPLLSDAEEEPMQYRRALARAVQKEQQRAKEAGETAPDYGVRLPRFTVNCYGCGVCEKLCPRQAIEIGPETDGSRLIFLTPWKCTGCGLCLRVCPHGGIAEMHTVSVPKLTQLALVRVPSASCERCGCPIPPGSAPPLCPSCAAKWRR